MEGHNKTVSCVQNWSTFEWKLNYDVSFVSACRCKVSTEMATGNTGTLRTEGVAIMGNGSESGGGRCGNADARMADARMQMRECRCGNADAGAKKAREIAKGSHGRTWN